MRISRGCRCAKSLALEQETEITERKQAGFFHINDTSGKPNSTTIARVTPRVAMQKNIWNKHEKYSP